MTTQTSTTDRPAAFTRREWCALHALHARYQQGRDLFTTRELARLRFMRWLYHTGRLVP